MSLMPFELLLFPYVAYADHVVDENDYRGLFDWGRGSVS